MQQVLILTTRRADLRSEIESWSGEDASLYEPNKTIGMTPAPKFGYQYQTVLEALAGNWKLLAPPKEIVETDLSDNTTIYHEWWLVREKR